MSSLRRFGYVRRYRPQVECLESRALPASLLIAPLEGATWLEMDLSLWVLRHTAETSAPLRFLLDNLQGTTHAGAGQTDTGAAVTVPASTTAMPAPGTAASATETAHLLSVVSATAATAEPQLASVVIDTSEDGLAHPQPGYRVVTITGGAAGQSGPGNILYASYLGTPLAEEVRAVALDALGNIYLAGTIDSGDPAQGFEAFVAKFTPGGQLLYGVMFGGLGHDEANGVDVDPQGNVYVSGAFTNQFGILNAFAARLNAAGDQFVWRRNVPSMPGSRDLETGFGKLRYHGPSHTVYFTGYLTVTVGGRKAGGLGRLNAADGSWSPGFLGILPKDGEIISTGIGVDRRWGDAYVAAHMTRNQIGDTSWWIFSVRVTSFLTLRWNRSYIEDGQGLPLALAADADGNSYAVGMIFAENGIELGLMKHSPTGQRIYRFSHPIIAGSTYTEARGIAVDAQGRSYVTGFYLTPGGDAETFLTRITPRLVGSSYEFDLDTFTFGGSGHDGGLSLAAQLNPATPMYAVIAGGTDSATDFPVTQDAYQPTYGGGVSDGFIARTRLPGA